MTRLTSDDCAEQRPLPRPAIRLAYFLSSALANWFRAHLHLRLRCVVPIQRGGDTVELHAWYDAHVFPMLQGPQAE